MEKYFANLAPRQLRSAIAGLVCLYWAVVYLVGLGAFLFGIYQIFFGQVERIPLSLLISLTGSAILWSAVPFNFSHTSPGIPLSPDQQPALFSFIRSLARDLQEPPPAYIFLSPDADLHMDDMAAYSPFLIGRRLTIGLLLMQTLGPQHIQALAAVELAAYSDTPDAFQALVYQHWRWILAVLKQKKNFYGRLEMFRWYGRLFMRLAAPLAHAHERSADQRAAAWAGSNILATALRSRSGTAAAYQAFLEHEFAPVIDAGFKPPVLEGFSRFLQSETVQTALQQVIISEASRTSRKNGETLPPLGWRLQSLQGISEKPDDDSSVSALRLLNNPAELETRLLNHLFKPGEVAKWKPITWDDTGVEVFLPIWQRTLRNYQSALNGVCPEDLSSYLHTPDSLWVQVKHANPAPLSKQELREGILRVCAIALTVALIHSGWQVDVPLGQAIVLSRGGDQVRPFVLLASLAAGQIDSFSWRRFTRTAGIEGIDLGQAA